MKNLDVLDRKILWNLDTDARQSLSDLARKVKHGRDIVAYRVERLVDQGILRGTSAVVNPYTLGFTIYKSYLRLRSKRTRQEKLLQAIRSNDQVFCYAVTDGNWDLIFNALATSPAEFESWRDTLLRGYREEILEYQFAIVLEQQIYPKKFLVPKERSSGWRIGPTEVQVSLDDRDIQVLGMLGRDARISVVDLAEALGITPVMARTSIERLEKFGVIVGYRVDIDRQKLGYSAFKAQISYAPGRTTMPKAIRDFSAKEPRVVSCIHQLGIHNFECNAVAESFDHFSAALDGFAESVDGLIDNVGIIIVNEERFNWVSRSPWSKRGKASVIEAEGMT